MLIKMLLVPSPALAPQKGEIRFMAVGTMCDRVSCCIEAIGGDAHTLKIQRCEWFNMTWIMHLAPY
jgi:hypothetical protein